MQSPSGPPSEYADRSYHVRRGHTPQISISDDNHHVTEAIGGMYESDDEDYMAKRNSRPLSFVRSPAETFDLASPLYLSSKLSSPPRTPLSITGSNERIHSPTDSDSASGKGGLGTENSPMSPPLSRRLSSSSAADTAVQQFPLNDIDYESSPAAVAQELSNLQAIRRMSMNVDTADPDLPSFGPSSGPPSPTADEDDASRLFWVPARLHPELAPKEFKTFVEDRVDRIRQRSGSTASLSPGLDRSNSADLRRKKSMLSRQIDSSRGYEDGAERLQRKRSESQTLTEDAAVDNLANLENLVSDPSDAIGKISFDSTRNSLDSGIDMEENQDMPILPSVGMSLKRSTRTTYRRGSLRKGERVPFSKRAAGRRPEGDAMAAGATSTESLLNPQQSDGSHPAMIKRVQTEPMSPPSDMTDTQSRAKRAGRLGLGLTVSSEDLADQARDVKSETAAEQPRSSQSQSRTAANGRTVTPVSAVPQIIETPPPVESSTQSQNFILPERKSSHTPPPPPPPPSTQTTSTPPRGSSAGRGALSRPPLISQRASHGSSNAMGELSKPALLPGSGAQSTDALTMVPTFEEKKTEKKEGGLRKTSWNWLVGGDEKAKDKEKREEKERRREREEVEKDEKASRKSKSTSSRLAKAPDKTRLDVLQSSIDGNSSRSRESLVLDRESVKLEDERKKEGSRKSGDGQGKKEKDSGILSAIFGGGKRAKGLTEDTAHKKRHSNRALSPEPPPRVLRPDVDYNWTRFSILEERAIYRMAHIKLANPKRALHSQVLLSNFMYSYLAKVQMMHPQMQIPAAQKAAQAKQQQQQQQNAQRNQDRQAEEYIQYQRWQEQQQQQQQQQMQGDASVDGDHTSEHSDGSGGQPSYQGHSRSQGKQQDDYQHSGSSGQDYLAYTKHEEQNNIWEGSEDDGKDDDLW